MPGRVVVKVPRVSNPKLVTALAEPPSKVNRFCRIGAYINEHPNGDAIKAAVGDPKWSAPQLAKALVGFNVTVGSSGIADHRAARCICYRQEKK